MGSRNQGRLRDRSIMVIRLIMVMSIIMIVVIAIRVGVMIV